jgi:tetratricopeptide (TPR) repeat protein
MSKQSRARAAAQAATSAKASVAGGFAPPDAPNRFFVRRGELLAGAFIVLAALAAYHNSFSGPFIYDDPASIAKNLTIRHLWPVWKVLSPPRNLTVGGRPLLNFSLALNYALSGDAVWSYHVLNLVIHVLAGLVLFGLVRRTLLQPVLRGRFGAVALPLALVVALLWTVHPLQTESVTYIIQRAESLMGLLYLLTLYCFVRGADAAGEGRGAKGERPEGTALALGSQLSTLSPKLWFAASGISCFLGMASKEVMVSAPLMVLLYDRTFVSGSFRAAWRQRRGFYLGLASTWLLLGYLVVTTGSRGGTAGFGSGSVGSYALTQFWAIVQYLRLSVWPQPLVLDYGRPVLQQAAAAAPYAAIIIPLVTLTVVGLWRNHPLGFLGAWFFAILAPSSSVVPVVTETIAEHRMYLSLAAVITVIVFGLYALLGRRSVAIGVALAVVLGVLTARRNEDYRTALGIWSDNVAKSPDNPWAHHSEGDVLLLMGRLTEAREQLEVALRLKPDLALSHNDMGVIADQAGRFQEAIDDYTLAVRFSSGLVDAHYNLAVDLHRMGRLAEAIDQYGEVIKANPDDFMAQCGLGTALAEQGHLAEALARFKEIARIFPESAEAHYNLGTAFIQLGRFTEALNEYGIAIQINPEYAEAHYNLGNTLVQLGRLPEAIGQYELTLRFKPDYADARKNLERAQKILAQSAAGSEK